MAPKAKPTSELGSVMAHGRSWRAMMKTAEGETARGPVRETELAAQEDLALMRAGSREEAHDVAAELRAAATDGRSSNMGQKGNPGGTGQKGNRGGTGNKHNRIGKGKCRRKGPKKHVLVNRFAFRTYKISGLDIVLAETAADLHQWPDMYTVKKLLEILRESGGSMDVRTYHNHAEGFARLYMQWPTLLHVNRSVRAAILWPQREKYTDVDMKSAHNCICQYYGMKAGIPMTSLLAYLANKAHKHSELIDQGLDENVVKQLWISLLNSGTVNGWRLGLIQKYRGHSITISPKLLKDLSLFVAEVTKVRNHVLP